jgi:aspartate aminotransferase/aminotransferase
MTLTKEELVAAAAIARKHNLLVISDEIYEAFTYGPPGAGAAAAKHESIAPLLPEQCILLKGYSKTYGMTGWRLGYAAAGGAARSVVEQMTKLQQYTFVCAPSMVQYAALRTVMGEEIDMSGYVAAYRRKRDMVVEMLSGTFELNVPGGAFYAFPKVPAGKGTATEFVHKAIERNVLIIPGNVFSMRDTHFRLSYATSDEKLRQGLEILCKLARE